MSINQMKKWVREHLPEGIFQRVQSVRRKMAAPNPLVAKAKAAFNQLNQGVVPPQIAMRPGIIWNVHPESREPFQWFCHYSPDMVKEFDLFMKERSGKARFLDIGANHGVYSLAFATGRPEVKGLAFDPSPLAFPILQHNIRANPGFNIKPLQVAAGDAEGKLRMKINWHHLEVISDQTAQESDQIKIVPVRPIDAVCEEENFSPDLIKVDVEGFELQCLKGLQRTLEKHRPVFLLEIHPDLIAKLHYAVSDITKFILSVRYNMEDMEGQTVETAFVNDRIHTTWLICRPRG